MGRQAAPQAPGANMGYGPQAGLTPGRAIASDLMRYRGRIGDQVNAGTYQAQRGVPGLPYGPPAGAQRPPGNGTPGASGADYLRMLLMSAVGAPSMPPAARQAFEQRLGGGGQQTPPPMDGPAYLQQQLTPGWRGMSGIAAGVRPPAPTTPLWPIGVASGVTRPTTPRSPLVEDQSGSKRGGGKPPVRSTR